MLEQKKKHAVAKNIRQDKAVCSVRKTEPLVFLFS